MGKIFVLDQEGIESLLSTALVGRIACCAPDEGEGRPYIVPLAYGYDGEAVYAFSSPGRKIHIMRKQPLISFEVDEAEAEDRWRSVVAEGAYEELTTEEGLALAKRAIFRNDPVPALPEGTIFYRLVLTQKTGRFELPDDEAAIYEAALRATA
ncbi:MAG TPA: pyridoxamine 5'-phosphate oxidase family protein [Thermomicrobiales bacterium]|nr:pyridoxamine 5'-phosphate oxidase family protein [Thermomicrobiales bacterium]